MQKSLCCPHWPTGSNYIQLSYYSDKITHMECLPPGIHLASTESVLVSGPFSYMKVLSCIWLFSTPVDCSAPDLPVDLQ